MSLLWSENSEYRFPKPAKQEKRKVSITEREKAKLREQVFIDQGEKCLTCSTKFATLPDMDIHHLKHSKMGGGSKDWRRENLAGLCRECHRAEHPGLQWGICKP